MYHCTLSDSEIHIFPFLVSLQVASLAIWCSAYSSCSDQVDSAELINRKIFALFTTG